MSYRIGLLTIGSEILDGYIVDTNSAWIAAELSSCGLRVESRLSVRDSDAEILAALEWLAGRSEAVIITGGLGPTGDDRTRDCVSRFTGRPLAFSGALWEGIRVKFRRFMSVPPEENRSQAMVMEGSEVLDNPRGTAPGFLVPGKPWIAAFPGVPSELHDMFPAFLERLSLEEGARGDTTSVWIKTVGIGESLVDEQVQKIAGPDITVGTVAHAGQVDVRLDIRLSALEGAEALAFAKERVDRFPDIARKIFSFERGESLAAALVRLLTEKGRKLVAAESCTGGLISKLVTDVPGSSAVFWGGAVTYDNLLKQRLLAVSRQTLEKHGAVSYEAAAEMLAGLSGIVESDYALSVTGIAGPDGGSEAKPVGTVFMGFRMPSGSFLVRFRFTGSRDMIRNRAALKALEVVWEDLEHGSVDFDALSGAEHWKTL
jgi:nicotinamide-nucleotide amidase